MPSHAVIFLETTYNRYSLAVLTGVLGRDERLENVDLHFVKFEERHTPGIGNIPKCVQQLCSLVRRYDKVVIALSFPTASIISISNLLTALHQEFTTGQHEAALIAAGGPHPSGDPAGTLQLGVDVVVVGEAEITFSALLYRFFRGQPFERVKGLWFVDAAGQYHNTGRPTPVDISDFPPFAMHHRRFCPMEISRGCPYGCRFCQTTFLMGGKMRHRSLDSILRYAELTRKLDLKVLRFITPSAFAYGSPDGHSVNFDALEQMLREVSAIYGKHGVYLGSFPSEVRPEQVTFDTLELVKRYCANTNILIGAQSGSDRMLHALRRGHGVDEIVRATERIVKADLTPNVDFIFGLPGETVQDRQATLALITRLTTMGARLHSHTFMPLAGTPLADCPPGIVTDDVRELMLSLRGKNQEHGRWQEQERLARKIFDFLQQQQTALL